MDMEGAEVLGLIGGRQLLREKRPILFFELDVNHMERFGYSLHNLSEILKNSNYRIFDVMSWRLNELDIDLLSADTHIDCLALPNELDNEREIAGIRIALIRGRLLPKLKYLSPLWF